MAVTDDIPDHDVQSQSPPLSPQYFNHTFALPVKCEDASSDVSTGMSAAAHKLLSSDTAAAAAAVDVTAASSSSSSCVVASSSSRVVSVTASSAVKCESDSPVLTQDGHCHIAFSEAVSDCQSDAAVACGAASIDVSVMSNSGQDALMTSPLVIQVLDMGFDYEQVRTVVHLNMVQSGEQYATTSDLVEALLAYSVAVSDIDTDIASCHLIPRQLQLPPSLLQQQQQQQQEQWAETVTTTSWSHDQHVSYDVTDDAATTAVATVISKRPGRKKKPRKNKNSSRTVQSQAAAAGGGGDNVEPNDAQFTLLQTSTSDTGSAARLAWEVEMENKRLRAMKRCKICDEADIGVVLMPCGHLVCCHGCATLLSRCTLCQTAVRDTVTIYMT